MQSGGQASLLQIRQDDKFYRKLLSKESSAANPSFRVYYGGAPGAVPFRWETQPGTPKHPTHVSYLPSPLTPPPSYLSSPRRSRSCGESSPSASGLLRAILPRLVQRTADRCSPTSPRGALSCSSVSSSSASSFSPLGSSSGLPGRRRRRRRFSSSKSSFSSMGDEDDPGAGSSPTSTLCFATPHHGDRPRGRYKNMVFVKDALLSIVGRGSGRGGA